MLFPGTDGPPQVQRVLKEQTALKPVVDALEGVPMVLLEAASDEIGRVVAGLLQMDLIDVVVSGWKKYSALTAAARRTLETPGEEQIVDLATHRITSTHRPRIDIVVDDVPVHSVDLQIDLDIVLHGVCAVVWGGRLMALRSGQAELEAELRCEGVPIKSARGAVDLAVEIGLGSGLQLVELAGYVLLPDAPG